MRTALLLICCLSCFNLSGQIIDNDTAARKPKIIIAPYVRWDDLRQDIYSEDKNLVLAINELRGEFIKRGFNVLDFFEKYNTIKSISASSPSESKQSDIVSYIIQSSKADVLIEVGTQQLAGTGSTNAVQVYIIAVDIVTGEMLMNQIRRSGFFNTDRIDRLLQNTINRTEDNEELVNNLKLKYSAVSTKNSPQINPTNQFSVNSTLNSLDCKTCKDALDLYYDAFRYQMQFSPDIFFRMKAIVTECLRKNAIDVFYKESGQTYKELNSCLKSYKNKFYGVADITRHPSPWQIGSIDDSTFSSFQIDVIPVLSSFKIAMNEQTISDCKSCAAAASKFYLDFLNDEKIPENELLNVKTFLLKCYYQLKDACNNKELTSILKNLTGEENDRQGAPGSSSIYRLDRGEFETQTIKDYKLNVIAATNEKNIGALTVNIDTIFSKNGLMGIMKMVRSTYYTSKIIFLDPIYKQIRHCKIDDKTIYLVLDQSNRYGIIDEFGKVLYGPQFDQIYKAVYGNTSSVLIYKKNNMWGMIIDSLKIMPSIYTSIEPIMGQFQTEKNNCNECIKDIYLVEKNGKVGLINNKGNQIIDNKYDSIKFHSIINPKYNLLISYVNGKIEMIKLIEYQGALVEAARSPKFDGFQIDDLSQFVFYKNDKKWGLLDRTNLNTLVLPLFDTISRIPMSGSIPFFWAINKGDGVLINQFGKIINSIKISGVENYVIDSDLFLVRNGALFGLLNRDGNLIANSFFSKIIQRPDSYFETLSNDKRGLINKFGLELFKPKYDFIDSFDGALALVKTNNKWGLIGINGEELIAPKYDKPFRFNNDIAEVSLNGSPFKINRNGQIVINKFQESDLGSLTIDGVNLRTQIEKYFEDMYTGINSMILLLGKSSVTQKDISDKVKDIQLRVEGWLEGPMTKSQLDEFNQINRSAAGTSSFMLSLLSNVLSSEASSSRPSYGDAGNSNRTQGNSSNQECPYCKSSDPRGYNIKDFNPSNRTYTDRGYVKRPGYNLCKSCWGTGLQNQTGPNTCNQCNGARFIKCTYCKGSGRKN